MIDLHGKSIDVIPFNTINIRNHGTMIARNARRQRVLSGKTLHVYPGGVLQTTNLLVNVDKLYVDVKASIEADRTGFEAEGETGFRV